MEANIGGAERPGNTRYVSPPAAISNPTTSDRVGISPRPIETPIIVNCTKPKRISAPVPAVRLRYANENAIAYPKRKNADVQFPFLAMLSVFRLRATTAASTAAPDTSRTIVKLAASIWPSANAKRQSIELRAKQTNAKVVNANAFIEELRIQPIDMKS
ncbi:hypothetical protein [Leptolyngbya sp. 7M]|uniref:hypothetical protein n=1 Tax=Leptolyngbya sp. 7M TaxID=2812896 RepID=UPI001B8AEE19|nr:hypothetical protein [Leptolyngbya sp. 7M]QYO63659.1 hypothetical protein JVX88_27895 [Leptolyngbya sp. 7M]